MFARRVIPETDNRSDWPRLVALVLNALQAWAIEIERSLPVDRDTDGNPIPTWKGHTFTYNDSGGLETDTVTDGTSTWVRTYTYDGGEQVADSGFVKQ